ncbi:hypothetical protein GCM10009565_20090 [Amycolatopsis albidoflavus]
MLGVGDVAGHRGEPEVRRGGAQRPLVASGAQHCPFATDESRGERPAKTGGRSGDYSYWHGFLQK